MKIAPVRSDPTDVPSDWASVTRTHPVENRTDRLRIERFPQSDHDLPSEPEDVHHSTVNLDAREAEDLLHALNYAIDHGFLSENTPVNAIGERTYDIELSWSGQHHTFSGVSWGADDALHSLLAIVDRLLDGVADDEMRRNPSQA
jgi:hypothetical protein